MTNLHDTPQPCGCVVITHDRPVTITGADMRGLVANVINVRRCPAHEADWKAGIRRMSDRIDRDIADKVFKDLWPTASAQGDGADE